MASKDKERRSAVQKKYLDKAAERGRIRKTIWVDANSNPPKQDCTLQPQPLIGGGVAYVPPGYMAIKINEQYKQKLLTDGWDAELTLTVSEKNGEKVSTWTVKWLQQGSLIAENK